MLLSRWKRQFVKMPKCTVLVIACWIGLSLTGAVTAEDDGQPGGAKSKGNENSTDLLLVLGAPGLDEFRETFSQWAEIWQSNAERAGLVIKTIGPSEKNGESSDRERIESALRTIATDDLASPLWIVLIGHGTWDGQTANFNLVGPDVSAKQFAQWTGSIKRPVVFVNCTSSSAPFINRLSGKNRVIVTATKSGSEHNFARFGKHFAEAFGSVEADLDHDDEVSVREAFLLAASETERFYKEQGRLATEHALLEDNGDQKGSSLKLVLGKASAKDRTNAIDGPLAAKVSIPATDNVLQLSAEQKAKRNELEAKLLKLKQDLSAADPAELRAKALPILIELARLYDQAAD